MPKISVLMSVYNCEKYIVEAVNSILNQAFTDFEFIIINDASTDRSVDLIKSVNDNRILLIENETNIGLTKSLNKALGLAKGKYIARMDADDIALPFRLEEQFKYMELHNEIGICGTWVETFNEKGITSVWDYPDAHEKIICRQFFNVGFAHPTVMFKRDLNIQYNPQYKAAQDYELWYRVLKITQGANLQKVCLKYRITENQISTKNKQHQNNTAIEVKTNMLKDLGIEPNEKIIHFHTSLFFDNWSNKPDFFTDAIQWFELIANKNKGKKIYIEAYFNSLLAEMYFNQCYFNSSFKFYKLLQQSFLGEYLHPSFKQLFKLKLKSLFK